MTTSNISLVIATLAAGLIAGLYYSYSCSVNPGLGRLPDAEYVTAMKSINEAILNPAFFCSFFGTLFLLPLAAYLNYNPGSLRFQLLLTGSLVYAFGSFGVTMFGNVPLNEALAAFDLKSASAADFHNMRMNFEGRWNSLHAIRTFATILAAALAITACLAQTAAAKIQPLNPEM